MTTVVLETRTIRSLRDLKALVDSYGNRMTPEDHVEVMDELEIVVSMHEDTEGKLTYSLRVNVG